MSEERKCSLALMSVFQSLPSRSPHVECLYRLRRGAAGRGRFRHSISSCKGPELNWSSAFYKLFPALRFYGHQRQAGLHLRSLRGLLSQALFDPLQSFPTLRGGSARPLHPNVVISLRNDNDADNGPTVTGHRASSLFFKKGILAFNKTGYLATAKAKERGRGKKAVARDGACLRWAARHVSGCIQGKQGRDNAWLFLYHEAKLFGSCPEGQLPQSLGKVPVVWEMVGSTEVGERITDLHKYRWYADGWEMTWSQFLVWCEPCLVHP